MLLFWVFRFVRNSNASFKAAVLFAIYVYCIVASTHKFVLWYLGRMSTVKNVKLSN